MANEFENGRIPQSEFLLAISANLTSIISELNDREDISLPISEGILGAPPQLNDIFAQHLAEQNVYKIGDVVTVGASVLLRPLPHSMDSLETFDRNDKLKVARVQLILHSCMAREGADLRESAEYNDVALNLLNTFESKVRQNIERPIDFEPIIAVISQGNLIRVSPNDFGMALKIMRHGLDITTGIQKRVKELGGRGIIVTPNAPRGLLNMFNANVIQAVGNKLGITMETGKLTDEGEVSPESQKTFEEKVLLKW